MVALLHWWTVASMTVFIACGHVGLHILFIRERLLGYLFNRNEYSPFLFSTLARNLCQFPGIFCLSQIHVVGTCPFFPLYLLLLLAQDTSPRYCLLLTI